MPFRKRTTDSNVETIVNIPELFKPLLAERFSVQVIEAGQPISQVVDTQDKILCLLSGRAQVVQGDFRAAQEVIVESLEQGDVFGDLAFLTGRRWPLEARLIASTPTTVLEISMDGFQRVLRENPEFTVALLKSLGKKTVRVDRARIQFSDGIEGGRGCGCLSLPVPSRPS